MKQILTSFWLVTLLLMQGIAQQDCVITIQTTDGFLPAAHIYFHEVNAPQINRMVLSNSHGIASIPVPSKTAIAIKYLGFQTLFDTLENSSSKIYTLKQDVFTINDVVVTAQYAPNSPEKTVHKIEIIDRKKIEAQGAVNLRDVLSNTTNIRIAQDNILGSSTSMQGLSGQNVKIMIDGVPVIGRLGGNIDLSQINLNTIERIELIEGPLSVEYGTNALAGTINLITKKNQKEAVNINVNSYYESVGQYNLDGVVGFQKGNNNFSLSAGRNYFDGWSAEEPSFQFPKKKLADSNRNNQWKPKEQFFGQFQFIRSFKELKIRWATDLFQEKITNKGKPRLPYYETAFDDYYRTLRLNNALAITGKVSKQGNVNLLFSGNIYKRRKNTYYKDLTTLEQQLTDNKADQDTTHYSLLLARGTYSTSKPNAKLNFSVGYDFNVETGKGARIANEKQTIGDYALFGSLEYTALKKLTLRPGLRYSYNTAYKAPLTPSFNARFNHKQFTFRGSYARGFRAPSVKDLYFNFVDINHNIVGNENLKAEHSNNYNLSVVWTKTHKARIYKTEATFFYNDINNLISLAQGEGASYTYFNLDRYKTKGLKLNGSLIIQHLKFSVGGSYVGRYNNLSEKENIQAFNYSPEVRSNLLYDWKKRGVQVALFYKYTGKLTGYFKDANSTIKQSLRGDFHTLDATLTKSFWNKNIQWAIGAKNLFDVKDVQNQGAGGAHSSNSGTVAMSWGRSFFTAFKININSRKLINKTFQDVQ